MEKAEILKYSVKQDKETAGNSTYSVEYSEGEYITTFYATAVKNFFFVTDLKGDGTEVEFCKIRVNGDITGDSATEFTVNNLGDTDYSLIDVNGLNIGVRAMQLSANLNQIISVYSPTGVCKIRVNGDIVFWIRGLVILCNQSFIELRCVEGSNIFALGVFHGISAASTF